MAQQPAPSSLKYLAGYAPALLAQVQARVAEGSLGRLLLARYPAAHGVRTDGALYDYVHELKAQFMRRSEPLSKVAYDGKLHVVRNALGTHTAISRVQGGKLKAKKEIRVASLFRDAAPVFLQMIVVHELAHLKEAEHNKAFYNLCDHMLPGYAQIEFDLRMYLTWRDLANQRAS